MIKHPLFRKKYLLNYLWMFLDIKLFTIARVKKKFGNRSINNDFFPFSLHLLHFKKLISIYSVLTCHVQTVNSGHLPYWFYFEIFLIKFSDYNFLWREENMVSHIFWLYFQNSKTYTDIHFTKFKFRALSSIHWFWSLWHDSNVSSKEVLYAIKYWHY